MIRQHRRFNNDLLSKPIPRWITFYGFGVLFVLIGILLYVSFNFSARRIVAINVVITPEASFIQSNIAGYEVIRTLEVKSILLPNNQTMAVTVDFTKSYLVGNNIHIPIIVLDTTLIARQFNKAKKIEGGILIDESSLLSKLFEKSKM